MANSRMRSTETRWRYLTGLLYAVHGDEPAERVAAWRQASAAGFGSSRPFTLYYFGCEALAVRGAGGAWHRDGRGAAMARRDNREYRPYLRAEQRRQRGCIARRMQRHLH